MPVQCLVITGPTASGKSALVEALAARVPLEIISADSAQVYKGMDIGTAKPDKATRARIPHHLLDLRDPSEPWSVADFCNDLPEVARQVADRGRLPVIVGGSMLYLKALKQGLAALPSADPAIRAALQRQAQTLGPHALHEELQAIDPLAAERIKPSDTQRLQRALEVYRLTGQPLTELQGKQAEAAPLDLLEIALEIAVVPPDRASLHQRIADRFMTMLAAGFVDEVKLLFDRGDLNATLPAIKAVGYRQVWACLAGELNYDEMVEKGIIATRQLAKRQYTWLRSWQGMHLFPEPDVNEVLKVIDNASILGHM